MSNLILKDNSNIILLFKVGHVFLLTSIVKNYEQQQKKICISGYKKVTSVLDIFRFSKILHHSQFYY